MEQTNRQFASMLSAARERLLRHTPEAIASRSGARFENGRIVLETFGTTASLRLPDCQWTPQLSKWHALTLLHYLDLSDGTPPRGVPIPFSQHTDGLVRGAGLDRNAELIIRRELGVLSPQELTRRCESLGGVIVPSNADLCARFFFAPQYPLWLKLWFSYDELPASGRLLLDQSAPHHLTIEDAVTVGSLVLDRLTGAAHWNA